MLGPAAWARLRGEFGGQWSAGLRLEHREDLYNRASSAALDLARVGSGWNLDLEGRVERHAPGALSSPLLFFDPDSLQSQAAANAEFDRSGVSVRLLRPADLWSARVELDYGSLRYDEPAGLLSDLGELRLEGGLELLLPASLRIETELALRQERYGQREASDGDWRTGRADLHLPAPAGWEFTLVGKAGSRAVADLEGLGYYERPGGSELAGGIALACFGAAELSLDASAGRERWDAYEGYFRSGDVFEIEAYEGNALGGDSRMDLVLRVEGFRPDSPSAEEYTISRGEELRVEASLFCSLRRSSSLPIGIGLLAENLRMRGRVDDSFRLLQAEVEGDWSPRPDLKFRCALRVDRYASRLAGEPEELEWGIGGDLGLEAAREGWTWGLTIARRQHVSFLEEALRSEDWEAALRIRWHP